MHAVRHAKFVASDGGGLQKETYFLNKPMLILRKITEIEPGVGDTAYLSKLDPDRVTYFLNRYKTFTRTQSIRTSPSMDIVDFFKKVSSAY